MKPTAIYGLTVTAALLAGCASSPLPVRVQRVSVPLPVPCRVATPARPAMPTETLPADAALDAFTAAAIAEIERREGYEGELRAALAACAHEGD